MIYKSGYGYGYGNCWIEGDGCSFTVYIMDGTAKRGPFWTLQAALEEFSHYCVS